MNIADKAKEIIYGDREKTYGDPRKNLDMIASMWSAYVGAEITANDVCNMMCLLKLARLKNTPAHGDSMIDIIGYTLLQERINNAHDDTEQNQRGEPGVRQGMECPVGICKQDETGRRVGINEDYIQCLGIDASN